ncbi:MULTISPECIES: tellurite resistance TerB family protein [unclassified Pseudomonas]|uniref:tellurite resistance TerB family protein n=1 Tax=unclassified Pseudomonas TaxID=196821 RepID=UPI0025F484A0|nr:MULTISPECIES: tellurite resistance TerB family protein [unclassified Pseudomonas]
MNTSDLLEKLLRASQGAATQNNGDASGRGGLGGLLGGLLGAGSTGNGAGGGLGGLLGGLLNGGGLAGRSGGTQTQPGGNNYAMLASLGMMAFQAYQAWQRQQASAPQEPPRTVDQLMGPEADDHSHAILVALIAAAKADGHIDDQEQQMINKEVARHADDPQVQQWLNAEVAKPLSAPDIAQAANGQPGVAAEMYLASVLMVNDQQVAERSYLDELAAALKIDPQLQVHLEQQAKGVAV